MTTGNGYPPTKIKTARRKNEKFPAMLKRETKLMNKAVADMLRKIAGDDDLLEVGRKAIEDTLIEWRDGGMAELFRANGLVVKHKDGSDSAIIRFGPETGVRLALRAIAAYLEKKK